MEFINSTEFIVAVIAALAIIINFLLNKRITYEKSITNKTKEYRGMQNVYVNKLHLIYLLIIAGVVLLSFIAINHWTGDGASTALNNWATASSIVLAIVAIVMTLVDIAGQRNNIWDLKETSEMMRDNLIKVQAQVADLTGIKETLLSHMAEITASNEKLRDDITKFAEDVNKGDMTEEEQKKKSEELLNNLKKDNVIYNKSEANVLSNFLERSQRSLTNVATIAITKLPPGEYDIEDFRSRIHKETMIFDSTAITKLLFDMHQQGKIQIKGSKFIIS
ncbi:hypothetical protein [Alkalicoccobacillus gibsonii]|uniref:hypothetical protein n=1 Tax=Alkalicoccobacillus gibsonii TaxID=79881 RepID=UPI001932B673|nr:hypothetical protein [Alkalicoccobacillus gibsonii]MBM0064942.1 hypothetical protein [Alkalicoccobacillus gibsonii]